MFLGLEGERIAVDTGYGCTRVVPVGLDLIEEFAGLFLEAVLAVEDNLEGVNWPDRYVGRYSGFLDPAA